MKCKLIALLTAIVVLASLAGCVENSRRHWWNRRGEDRHEEQRVESHGESHHDEQRADRGDERR